jgi:DNA-binding transcriptional LysR family regulator
MDKLRAMRTFMTIADAGSLTAAARVSGSSLPAVVRLLAALEAELGARLFHRTTRRIALTDAGRRYLERCREVNTLVDEAEAEVRAEQTQPRGTLTLTAPVFFGTRHVARGVTAFIQRYPEVRVDFRLLDRVVDMLEEGIDVGVRIGQLEDSSLIARPVSTMRRLIVAAPSYLERRGSPQHPKDLRAHNCILLHGRSAIPWTFSHNGKVLTVPVQGSLDVNQVAVAAEACVAGLGVGTFFAYQVAREIASGALAVLLADFETAPRPVHVVYPDARLLPARTRVFIDFIMRHIQVEQVAWQPAESKPESRSGGATRSSKPSVARRSATTPRTK